MFDLTLELIGTALGDAAMNEVACMFQHPVLRSGSARQKVPVLQSARTVDQMPPAVKQAISIFSENVETPVGIREVARRTGISPRQLERSFRTATGLSPGEYYRRQRLKTARQMVRYSWDSISGHRSFCRLCQFLNSDAALPQVLWRHARSGPQTDLSSRHWDLRRKLSSIRPGPGNGCHVYIWMKAVRPSQRLALVLQKEQAPLPNWLSAMIRINNPQLSGLKNIQ